MHQYFSPFGVNGILAKNTDKVALRLHCFQIELTFGKFRFLSELQEKLWQQKSETITLALVWSSATGIEFWATLVEMKALVSSVGGEVTNENITSIKKIDRGQITTVKGL